MTSIAGSVFFRYHHLPGFHQTYQTISKYFKAFSGLMGNVKSILERESWQLDIVHYWVAIDYKGSHNRGESIKVSIQTVPVA